MDDNGQICIKAVSKLGRKAWLAARLPAWQASIKNIVKLNLESIVI
jgi:hypothetical protein